jgi:hypothetical protein
MNERPASGGLFTGLADGRVSQLVHERLLAPPTTRTGSHPLSDPLRSASGDAERKQKTKAFFRTGFVIQSIPHKQCYRVRLDDMGGTIRCARVDVDGRLPVGGRTIGILPAHTRVLVWKPAGETTGFIVNVMPPDVLDPLVYRPSYIWPGGEAGFYRDAAHNTLLKLNKQGRIRDYGAGAPIDETQLDRGWVFETGLMLQGDPFMLQMKVNEFSGLLMTLWDSYVRLGGVNYDFATSVHDQEVRLDQGELRSRMGKSVYFWEALGRTTPGVLGEVKDFDAVFDKIPEALYDLKTSERDVVPIYRVQEFDGYEGQAGLKVVTVPDFGADIKHRGQSPGTTVFMESIDLDGGYSLASAKQVGIFKRSALPNPALLQRPEDKRGDTDADYRFASMYGLGPDHKIGDVQYGERTGPAIHSTIDDLIAHMVNWRPTHPFHYHKKDYSNLDLKSTQLQPSQEAMTFQPAPMSLPAPKVLKIDHRWARGQYYSRSSGLVLTDDGSVVIFDGYGNRISMGPEGIRLESAVRVAVYSGGDVIQMGKQVVVKAHDSIDLSSSNKDVRIFAKNNLQVSGYGVLVESTGTDRVYAYKNNIGENVTATGITLRSKTDTAIMGDNVYLRSGVGDSGEGDIALDAAKREGKILFEAEAITGFVTNAFTLFNQAIGGELQQTVSLGGSTALINTPIVIGGYTVITGDNPSLVVEGNTISKGNIISLGRMADSVGGPVGQVDDKEKPKLEEQLTAVEEQVAAIEDTSTTIDDSVWANGWHVANNIGNDEVLEAMGFSFRDDDDGRQYGVATLAIAEPRWVTLARLGGVSGTKSWNEDPIQYQGKELHSWPGRKNWSELTPLSRPASATDSMYDYGAGIEQDRGDRYETPRIPAPEKVSFRDGLRVLQ